MKEKLSVMLAFMRRDAIRWSSYRYDAFSWFLRYMIMGFSWAYFASVVEFGVSEIVVAKYGPGITFLAYFMISRGFGRVIHFAWTAPRRVAGPWNLEWLLLSPATFLDVILGTSWFHYMIGLFQVSVFLLFGIVNGAVFHIDILSLLAILVMSAASIWGLGMVSAGVQIVTKRWDPVTYIFYRIGWLISGLFFPISLLPTWLQPITWLIPQSYILEMARQSMLAGKSIFQMGMLPVYLLMYSIISLAIGSWVFIRCVQVAKRQGTIGFF